MTAYEAAFRILHGGRRADWNASYANRPDWQAAVRIIFDAIRTQGQPDDSDLEVEEAQS